MSKRPHTKYDKTDAEIEEMVNRQLASSQPTLRDLVQDIMLKDGANGTWKAVDAILELILSRLPEERKFTPELQKAEGETVYEFKASWGYYNRAISEVRAILKGNE